MNALDPNGPVYLGCPCGRAALSHLFELCLCCQIAALEAGDAAAARPTDRPVAPGEGAASPAGVSTVRLPRPDPWVAFEGALARCLAAQVGLHAALHRVPLDRYPEAVVRVVVELDEALG